jgi:serine/threonine protein kinase/tetratricopeptide (TPR) repeat protein
MDPTTTGHWPTPQDWRLFLLGRLPADQLEALEAHLLHCPLCLQVVASLESHDESVRALQARLMAGPDRASVADLLDRLQQLYTGPTPPMRGGAPTTDGSHPPRADTVDDTLPQVPGYEILGELGRGGMGVVYKARQLRPERVVALKMLRDGALAGPSDVARFRTEADTLARLQHANIAPIYEVGEWQAASGGPLPFFSLEFCAAGSLEQALHGTPVPGREAAAFVETLARAMDAAHQQGIIHRDLKPGNILLATTGPQPPCNGAAVTAEYPRLTHFLPKIMDFGLAKQMPSGERPAGEPHLTASGAVVGTPSYMAPEQAAGRLRDIGPWTDVYALGAILYELLTGRPPFKAATPHETMLQVLQEEAVPPRRLNPAAERHLETICLTCLRKEPARRYVSALALADDLRGFLEHRPIWARPTPPWERAFMWARRHPARAALTAVAAAIVVGLALAGYWVRHREDVRLAELRGEIDSAVQRGQSDLDNEQWQRAEGELAEAVHRLEREPALADLYIRANRLLERVHARLDQEQHRLDQKQQRQQAQEWSTEFRRLQDQAFFASIAAEDADQAQHAAEEALSHLKKPTPLGLDATETQAVLDGRYELLLIQAGLVKDPDQGLHLLDRAGELRHRGKAWYQQRATLLARKKDEPAAAREREQAAKEPSADALDYFLLGQQCLNRGQLGAAMEQFQAALRLQPDHFWAEIALGLCCFRNRQRAQAVASLTACQVRRPEYPWTYIHRGLARGFLGFQAPPGEAGQWFTLADEDFERAEHLPLTDEARYVLANNRAITLTLRHRPDLAVPILQTAVRDRPNQYNAYVNLAVAYGDLGWFAAARVQLDRAVTLKPGLATLRRHRADLHGRLASLHSAFANRAVLAGPLTLTTALVPAAGMVVAPLPHVANPKRELEAALADNRQAIALFEAEPSTPPADLALAHAACGQVLARLARPQEAGQAYLRAVQLSPTLCEAHLGRGGILLAEQRYADAADALDAYQKCGGPHTPDFYAARALARAGLRRYAFALADINQALERSPRSPRYLALRGWLYLILEQPQVALSDFTQALQEEPGHADSLAGRGFVLAQRGAYRKAAADGEAILAAHPMPDRDLAYKVVRLFTQAAVAAARTREPDGPPRALIRTYEDRALRLLRQLLQQLPAEQRVRFWQQIADDPALLWLRHLPDFERLAPDAGLTAQRPRLDP